MNNKKKKKNDVPKELFKKAIVRNDIYFNGIKDRLVNMDDSIKRIMYEIDKSKYISGTTMMTRFGEYLDLKYLSTGCKTAINVYMNPNVLVYCVEAGDNAQELILKLSNGNVLIPIVPSIHTDFKLNATLFMNGTIRVYNNSFNLMEAWDNG